MLPHIKQQKQMHRKFELSEYRTIAFIETDSCTIQLEICTAQSIVLRELSYM